MNTTEETNRTRGLHRGTSGHKPTCQCAFCKAARYTQLVVSNNHNAAEVVRLAESLRLVEQGRDEAIRGREAGLEQIKKLQDDLTLAHRTSEGYKATIADLRSELVQTERSLERQSSQLHTARKDANALVEAAQEQGMIRRAQFTVAGLIVSLLAGAVMFFVGRWAR